jgi:hypothetical protein
MIATVAAAIAATKFKTTNFARFVFVAASLKGARNWRNFTKAYS